IENQRIGNDEINHFSAAALALRHTIANHFAAAEFDLLAVQRKTLLNLNPQFSVTETHAIAHGGAEHIGICTSIHFCHDCVSSPEIRDCPSRHRETHRHGASRRKRLTPPCASAPAQIAPPCQPQYSGENRAPLRDQIAAPDWFLRRDSE